MDEDQINTDELTLDQKVQILMGELPRPVQEFLRSPERDRVSLELSSKYNLHADQAGVFSRAYIYMLLGVYTPEEFVQELRDTGIAEATVQGLTQDVNERVFKRLQNAQRDSSVPAPEPAPYIPPAPKPQTTLSVPAPFAPVPQSMPATAPISAPPAPSASASSYATPHPEQPALRTMAQDMQEMKEEREHPHQASQTPVPPHVWQPSSPARSFQTSSVPNTQTMPAPAHQAPAQAFQAPVPIAHPPIPAAPVHAPAAPVPHNLPTQPSAYPWQPQSLAPSTVPISLRSPSLNAPRPQGPIIKEYGIDPYRETPE